MIRKLLLAATIAAATGASPAIAYYEPIGAPFRQAEAFMYSKTGLFGDRGKFSAGVFTVTEDAVKEYPALRAYKRAHYQKQAVYESAKANYRITGKPIILLGHSLGANATLWIAHRLKADGIPVAAIFAYDPTPTRACVPDNVIAAIGWRRSYILNLGGARIAPCPGNTKTAIKNHLVIGGHTYVDDAPEVHRLTRKHIGEVVHMIREMEGAK